MQSLQLYQVLSYLVHTINIRIQNCTYCPILIDAAAIPPGFRSARGFRNLEAKRNGERSNMRTTSECVFLSGGTQGKIEKSKNKKVEKVEKSKVEKSKNYLR